MTSRPKPIYVYPIGDMRDRMEQEAERLGLSLSALARYLILKSLDTMQGRSR